MFFFFKQKTAYEMRISDWSSDVCSSDLTTVIHNENARIEIQIRSKEMHHDSEFGLAAHWAYKQRGSGPDGQAVWIRDLIEILEQSQDADELLEHTRMAMYQDRIFAFTPKGELQQLPKGSTAVDFAYAVHTNLGNQPVGAKVNGRVVPLRTPLQNGDQVEILKRSAERRVGHECVRKCRSRWSTDH